MVVSVCFFAVIFSMNDSLAKSPELHYPTLKFEDVGGNEETLVVSTVVLAALSVATLASLIKVHCCKSSKSCTARLK